jgi:integrase
MALTDLAIKGAKPNIKSYKLFDGGGLYIEISPNGGKWWRYKYRFNGSEKRISLGTYPDISLKEARARHLVERNLLANGQDPSAIRKTKKIESVANTENTFEAVAREWWLAHMANKAESHKNKVLRRFELYLFPWLGARAISSISPPELLACLKRIHSLNKLETAHRALQTSGQVFRYAVQTGRADRDISTDLKGALPPTKVKHMAAFTEPEEAAELLNAIDGFNGTITVKCALRLAPLVFTRPSELRRAKWSDIDFENEEWRYLVSKTQTEHIVPLSKQAINILKEIHPLSGHGEFVFMGGHSPLKPMSESAINAALKRMGYNTQLDITGHGFRAMARTIIHEILEIDPHIIEHQLAHKVPDNLGKAYNRTKFLRQRKTMMQTWADYLDKIKTEYKK